MPYLEGSATKYVSRWWKKGGVVDLRKARHFVQRLMDEIEPDPPTRLGRVLRDVAVFLGMTRRPARPLPLRRLALEWCDENDLGPSSAFVFARVATWSRRLDLEEALEHLDVMIADEEDRLTQAGDEVELAKLRARDGA